MKERGYATAFFGKWHLGKRDPSAPLVGEAHAKMIVPPEARGGFEHWLGFESGFLLNNPWLHGTLRGFEAPKMLPGYQSDVLLEYWAYWMTQHGKIGPNFTVVSLEAPHPPYDAPAAGVKGREPGEIILPANVPRGGEAEAKARKELAGYYAHIEATDRVIGEFCKLTRQNWIVVSTSVHGDMHGAHGLFRKGWPYEESVRVPLLIRAPGVKARQDDAAVSLVDLAAMTTRWAENGVGEVSDLSWIGRGGSEARPTSARISMPSVVALPHQCDRVWRGVRTKTRKLVLTADGTPWLFFDLERDPLEMKNLAGEPARAAEIEELRRSVG